jgi:hypothetical protein
MITVSGMTQPIDVSLQRITHTLILNGHSDDEVNWVAGHAKPSIWNDMKPERNRVDERV